METSTRTRCPSKSAPGLVGTPLCARARVEGAPAPPSPLEPVRRPAWATPDPGQGPAGANVPVWLWETTDGKDIIRGLATGTLRTPLSSLLGLRLREAEDDRVVITMPASEWFCRDSRTVS